MSRAVVAAVLILGALCFAACSSSDDSESPDSTSSSTGFRIAPGGVTPVVAINPIGRDQKYFNDSTEAALDSDGNLTGDALKVAELLGLQLELERIRASSGRYPPTLNALGPRPTWLRGYSSSGDGGTYELQGQFSGEAFAVGSPR